MFKLTAAWAENDMQFLLRSNVPFAFQMLHNMKGQFAEHLMNTGFVSSRDPKDPASNVNSGK